MFTAVVQRFEEEQKLERRRNDLKAAKHFKYFLSRANKIYDRFLCLGSTLRVSTLLRHHGDYYYC